MAEKKLVSTSTSGNHLNVRILHPFRIALIATLGVGLGIVLIAAMKMRWFESLNHPLDGGSGLFGANKTWRGVIIHLVVATTIVAALHSFSTGYYRSAATIDGSVRCFLPEEWEGWDQ